MNRTELLELIDTKMNKLFNEYQKSNNIQYGDISPENVMELQGIENQLTDFIIDVDVDGCGANIETMI